MIGNGNVVLISGMVLFACYRVEMIIVRSKSGDILAMVNFMSNGNFGRLVRVRRWFFNIKLIYQRE